MQLPSTKKRAPGRSCLPFTPGQLGRSCLPPFFYAALYDPDALAYPGTCLVNGTCHRLLAPNLSPTRSLLPRRRAVGRPPLPTLSGAATGNISSAPARQEGTHVVRPGRPNLTKSSSCLCLPCTFPPARRFRPCGLWQPSLGGTPQ